MFILNNWPKTKAKIYKGGRPQIKKDNIKIKPDKVCQLEYYLVHKIINEVQYRAALSYQRVWCLYVKAIEAPRIKISNTDITVSGKPWSEFYIRRIEEQWDEIQSIIKSTGHNTRSIIDEVVCFNRHCPNIAKLRFILDKLSKEVFV